MAARRPPVGENAHVTHPVLDEAMKKAAVAWVAVGTGPALALWCLPWEGSLYVVSGPGEQPAPDLPGADRASVTLRGDHGGQVITWPATVDRVSPGTQAWTAVAPQLAAKRLNAPGTAAALVERWVADGVAVHRLAPADDEPTTGGALPDTSQAATPRGTANRRPVRMPFRLHRVRRRRP